MGTWDDLDRWDAGTVAAATFTGEGIVDRWGPTDRSYPLASVSKVLAAVATMVAVEEGSVGLDDAAGPPGATLRHLLSHASGLAPDGDRTDGNPADGNPADGDPADGIPADGDTVPQWSRAVLGPPGRRRIYSNLGIEAAAAHVTDRTGLDFAVYVHEALVDPFELSATTITGSPAHEYRSSVDDLVTVVRAVLDGTLLHASSLAAMTTPQFPDLDGVLPGFGSQRPNPWGLGVEVRGTKDPHWTSPSNGPATWGHFGQSGTFLWYDPGVDLGLVVLTERAFGPWAAEAWPRLSSTVLDALR